jgi:hypothetical protein
LKKTSSKKTKGLNLRKFGDKSQENPTLFLKYCEEGANGSPGEGPQSKELGILSKGPVGIREALGAVVGVFLQSFLYIRPEL